MALKIINLLQHSILMVVIYITNIRFLPAYIAFSFSRNNVLKEDFNVWKNEFGFKSENDFISFYKIFWSHKAFRDVIYLRLGHSSRWISWLAKGECGLYIATPEKKIGSGIFIHHGHSTQINAKTIGHNCQIWHNVTIGVGTPHDNNTRPTIGDNVRICAGAIVIGDIEVGNNVTIGAGSVVTKSIPDNCIIVGNPARIIKRIHLD